MIILQKGNGAWESKSWEVISQPEIAAPSALRNLLLMDVIEPKLLLVILKVFKFYVMLKR